MGRSGAATALGFDVNEGGVEMVGTIVVVVLLRPVRLILTVAADVGRW